LLSGGGMRVKIVEGLALGKTIISTSVGAEGIAYENKKNILIADNVAAFVEAIDTCIENNVYCDSIGKNGRTLAETTYNNSYICFKLSEFYKTFILK
jgi:glycosyltransferase involved in cell wall biosynthesis